MCVDYCVNNDNNTYEISAQGIDECMLNVHLLLLTSGWGGHWAGGTKLEAHRLKSVTVYWAGGTSG